MATSKKSDIQYIDEFLDKLENNHANDVMNNYNQYKAGYESAQMGKDTGRIIISAVPLAANIGVDLFDLILRIFNRAKQEEAIDHAKKQAQELLIELRYLDPEKKNNRQEIIDKLEKNRHLLRPEEKEELRALKQEKGPSAEAVGDPRKTSQALEQLLGKSR